MSYSVTSSRIIQDIFYNTFILIEQILMERKSGSITDDEWNVIKGVINRIADKNYPDFDKIIEEQDRKIEELEQKLFNQSFELISKESRNMVREIRIENQKLKSENLNLKDRIQLIGNEESTDERMRQVKAGYIAELVAENNRLQRENTEIQGLADLGQKMRDQQKKGRRKRKDIKDDELIRLHALGFKTAEIYRTLREKGINCCKQTVINRIEALKKEGVIS